MIQKVGNKWLIYSESKPRKVLGSHRSERAALRQEAAIKMATKRRHGRPMEKMEDY